METGLILGALGVISAFGVLWWAMSSDRREGSTLSLSASTPRITDLRVATLERGVSERTLQPLAARFARSARRVTPSGWLNALEHRILAAGTPPGWTMERVLAAKGVFGLTGAAIGALRMAAAPSGVVFFFTLLISVGLFFLPDLALKSKAEERQKVISRSLADTMDQLTISVQAGLGVDAAIARVARTTEGPLGSELARVVQDTQAGVPRIDALMGLTERVKLPELRQFVAAMAQAEKLGVPVAQTLKVQASEMRLKRRQAAEEQAMKVPVKILFPTVVCILPTLFIVLLGPAALKIANVL